MRKMRVLFLDVDGVLNSDRSRPGVKPTGGILGVDDDKLLVLQQIVRRSGAFIVLTSTWKRSWGTPWQPGTMRFLIDKLQQHNIRIMGATTESVPSERGRGIREWLDYHGPVDGWAVLDDDIFPDYAEYGILPRLIKTNFYRGGLTKDKITPCVTVLEEPSDADIGCGVCPFQTIEETPDGDPQVVKRCADAASCPVYKNEMGGEADAGSETADTVE